MIRAFIRRVFQRSATRTFRRSLALILVAEIVTAVVAWRLLDYNTTNWIRQKATQTARVSAQAAASADWSRVDKITGNKNSPLFDAYQKRLDDLTQRNFSRKQGSIYVAVVKNDEEYVIASNEPSPLADYGVANQWELEAYKSGKPTVSPVPIVDDTGTYLAAYTPILKNGRVIGLVAAEYDEAPMADFQAIVRKAFWMSLLPGILASLVVAYILASMLVDPMDVFRSVEQEARAQRQRSDETEPDPWDLLTPKEKEVAEFARQGLTYEEIAKELSVSPETVKQHFKNIAKKTGLNKIDLAVKAQARRTAASAHA